MSVGHFGSPQRQEVCSPLPVSHTHTSAEKEKLRVRVNLEHYMHKKSSQILYVSFSDVTTLISEFPN